LLTRTTVRTFSEEVMAMETWWTDIDDAVLEHLRRSGPATPGELAAAIGASEGETVAFLAMLAREGKIRIARVEIADLAAARRHRARRAAA
jgi:DNA-binding Lrp family transcriptional regulator